MKPKRWHRKSTVAVLLLGFFVLWAYRAREKDPIFQGKPLSKHLESCRVAGIHLGAEIDGITLLKPIEPHLGNVWIDSTAREAVLREGTNALPMLLRMLTWGDTRGDQLLRFMVQKYGLPHWFIRTNWRAEWENQTRALAAFHTLGSTAAPAAGRIVRLLNDPETALRAIVALTLIRPDREDYILSLTNVALIRKQSRTGASPDMLLSAAVLALGSFGPKASNAIPFLINSLSSTNDNVQAAAAVALVRVGAPPEKVVPLIVKTLPKTDPTPPAGAIGMLGLGRFKETLMKIWALEQFGPKASDALPMLSVIEKFPTVNFQEAARNASATIKGENYIPGTRPK